jgi:hypothetical protein
VSQVYDVALALEVLVLIWSLWNLVTSCFDFGTCSKNVSPETLIFFILLVKIDVGHRLRTWTTVIPS